MTFTELYQKYLGVLWQSFEYDISVFSQGWIYYWALIPASFYSAFFFIKWIVLTAPLWIPFAVVASAFGSGEKTVVYSQEPKGEE